MDQHKLGLVKLFAILLVMAGMAFVITGRVHAQDSVPADPTPVIEPTAVPTDPPAAPPDATLPSETTSVDPAVPEAALPDPVAVTEPVADVPPSEAPAEVPPVVEIPVEPVPTEVVPETEAAIPPVTEEVAPPAEGDTVVADTPTMGSSSGDPYYTYAGITHYFFTAAGDCAPIVAPNVCTVTATPIMDAIANATTVVASGSVTIYVEGNHTYAENVVINANPRIAGLSGSLVSSLFPQINGTVQISNMTTAFSLNGFTINATTGSAGLTLMNNTAAITLTDVTVKDTLAGAHGIHVSNQSGTLTMNRVTADHSDQSGMVFTGSSGALVIKSSSFDNNGDTGLFVNSTGSVTMNGVSASNNPSAGGAYINTTKPISITNASFSNNSNGNGLTIPTTTVGTVTLNTIFADSNSGVGLYLYPKGNVTLSNIEAIHNGSGGVTVDTCGFDGIICQRSGTVSITNANLDENYNGANLFVKANGAVTINNIAASHATGSSYGARIINNYSASAAAVTVNNGTFSYNTSAGLSIDTRGSVSLNHIEGDYNTGANGYGLQVFAATGTGTVTLLNTLGENSFSHNSQTGVYISAKGTISLTGLEARFNGTLTSGNGARLDNSTGTGGITIKNGDFDFSQAINLYILTHGNTSLTDVSASQGGQGGTANYGAMIYNGGTTGNPTVTITRGSFNYNTSDGLYIQSRGTITLNTIEANYNTPNFAVGARLDTFTLGGTGGVTITKPASGTNQFTNNASDGLNIISNGLGSIASVYAYNNGGAGALIDNHTSTTSADVTVNSFASVISGSSGLRIISKGNIKVDNAEVANCTAGYGIDLDNDTYTIGAKTVTMSNISTHNNPAHGLYIQTKGAVSIKTIDSVNHTGLGTQGIHINVNGNGSVTIGALLSSDVNDIYAVPGSGLYIRTGGAISLSNMDISNTGDYGADLDNPTSSGSVTITNSHFDGNPNYGLRVVTLGAITLNGGSASVNTATGGAQLWNYTSPLTSAPGISVSKFEFNSNAGTGLDIRTKGSITLNNVYAQNNTAGGNGAYLNNVYSTVKSPVTILGVSGSAPNSFVNNGADNLWIYSNGTVTLNVVGCSGSVAGRGAVIDNTGGTGGVTITGSSFINNPTGSGLEVSTNGAISLTSVDASGNGNTSNSEWGAALSTQSGVTIKTGTFNGNTNRGLDIFAGGNISLTNIAAINNGVYPTYLVEGAYIVNTSSPTATVTLTNNPAQYTFSNNTSSGLVIKSNGKVTLSGVEADSNKNKGIYVDNYNLGSGTGDVSITNVFSKFCGENALEVYSNGAITLTGATITNAGYPAGVGNGAVLDNHLAPTAKAVMVSKGTFSPYNGTGLSITTKGNVTLNAIVSGTNYGPFGNDGVYIDASYASTSATISILSTLGPTSFYENAIDGLYIHSGGGPVTLTGINVYANVFNGAHIQDAGTVTVSNSNFYGNENGNGLWVDNGSGNITLTNVVAYDNNDDGAHLDNSAGPATVTVTVNKSNFHNNSLNGLEVVSRSTVTLNGVHGDKNRCFGASIDNYTYGTGGVIILSSQGANSFNQNSGVGAMGGLYIHTNGAVTASNVTANDNSLMAGVTIFSGGAVTLTTGTFTNNVNEGMLITAQDVVTLTGVNVYMNGRSSNGDGININSNFHDVKITNGVILGNGRSGIFAIIGSGQKLVLTNVLVVGNNRWGGTAPNVWTNGALTWV